MNDDTILWAFLQNYHADKMNAAIHCAPVKFSPLTFRLLDALFDEVVAREDDITPEMREVRSHTGAYELDPGR